MNRDGNWSIPHLRQSRGAWLRAEDILLQWLLRLPIDVEPVEAALAVLTEAPSGVDETPAQQPPRGFLIEMTLCGVPEQGSRAGA